MAKAMEPSSKSRKESILIKYAVVSRLLVLFLTILWRSFLQPYDTSAALNPPCLHHRDVPEDSPPLIVANPLSKTLENSVVWDSVYFLRITQCGYEYEQTYAFLPLLPFFISLLSRTGNVFWFFLNLFEFSLMRKFVVLIQFLRLWFRWLVFELWWCCLATLSPT